MSRRVYYSVSALVVMLIGAACQARSAAPSAPILAVIVTNTPGTTPSQSALTPPTAAPILTPTDAPSVEPPIIGGSGFSGTQASASVSDAANSPTPVRAVTRNPKAIQQTSMIANIRDNEIIFVTHVIGQSAEITAATVSYTFDGSKKGAAQPAQLPPQTVGQPLELQTTILLDDFPKTESSLTYHWALTDADGNSLTSSDGHFKLTEATRSDQRDDLPMINATMKFTSAFPDSALFTVTIKPARPVVDARFFITQNHGILVNDYHAEVKSVDPGQPLTVSFDWGPALSLQIPWQQFETWWVFTDELGHTFRTQHALNDYSDNRHHKWTRTPTRYAVLYTYDQPAANVAALVTATDHSMEVLQGEFGYKLLYAPHIVIYNNNADFSDWAPPAIEDRFIGMASGRWGGAVIGVYQSIHFTGYSIIKHELTHVFQYQSIQQQELPKWFIEGSARYMEEEPEEDDEAVTRQICKAFGAPTLQLEVPDFSPDRRVSAWPYYVGMTFIKYLRATYGKDAFAKTYLALAHNVDLPTALESVTGKSFAELDKGWQDWIVR